MNRATDRCTDRKNHAGSEASSAVQGSWSAKSPAVISALRFIAKKGQVTAEQLVEWDARNGRRLFPWDDSKAAHQHRLYMARVFLNTFRLKLPNMRVRKFINLPENGVKGNDRAYFDVATITTSPDMRAAVIADLTSRMASLAKELRFWKLSEAERRDVLMKLDEAMAV